MLSIKRILEVTHASSELTGQVQLQGLTQLRRGQKGKKNQTQQILEYDTIAKPCTYIFLYFAIYFLKCF